tara:strand:- start:96 stop:1454 length:1359 start_codon:yes stop_codon:yes gene_type:complete
MPNTNDSHGESKIIFENDDWLIVEPFDYESYTYYAPENMKSQWNRYRDGDVYLIVDKNSQTNTGLKTYMIYINRGSTYYYLWNGNEASTKKRFINYLSDEIVEQVNDIVGEGKLYSLLVKIQNGEEVSSRELENADESIYDFKYTPKAPFKSKITLSFDDDEYVGLFDPSDDDLWYYRVITGNYDTYEFESDYQSIEDFQQGYIENFFRGENFVKLKQILSIILPDSVELDTDEKRESAGKKLYDMFEREIEEIISDYVSELNACKTRGFEKEIKESLCHAFFNDGIFTENCFNRYFTSVGMLVALYDTMGDTSLTIKELLFKIGSDMNLVGWSDYIYEYECDDFDNESIDRYVSGYLDKIMEKLEDESQYVDIHEYSELYKRLALKYKVGSRYYTKNNRDFFYRGIDPANNRILIQVFKKEGGLEDRSYTEEEFNNFLVSPELFEGFIRIN